MDRTEWDLLSNREQRWIAYSRGARIERRLRALTDAIRNLTEKDTTLMATVKEVQDAMDGLTAQVARETDETAAAITFIHGLSDQIRQLAADATSLDDLKTAVVAAADHAQRNADDIAAAIVTPGDGGTAPADAGTSTSTP